MSWKFLVAFLAALLASSVAVAQSTSCGAAGGKVSIIDYGAAATPNGVTPDGTTNNLSAINAAIASAKQLRTAGIDAWVYVPVGTFAYQGSFVLDGLTLCGEGATSVLYSLDPGNQSIYLIGDGPAVKSIRLTGPPTTRAVAEAHIKVYKLLSALSGYGPTDTRNFVIDGVTIDMSGIFVSRAWDPGIFTLTDYGIDGAGPGVIANNTLTDTVADSIHMTSGTHDIEVSNNRIYRSGDDGIAVVSYRADLAFVHNISVHDNEIHDNVWGRNMSVVGGSGVTFTNNLADGNPNAACLYLAEEEGAYQTFAAMNVTAQYNTLRNCGSWQTGHSSVTIVTENPVFENDGLDLLRNDVMSNAGLPGIAVGGYNSAYNFQVTLDSNRITGVAAGGPDIYIDAYSNGYVTVIPYVDGPVGYVLPATN